MRLLPKPAARITSGEILFEGEEILTLSEDAVREIRGNRMAMIFQDPMTSLNPVLTVERQLTEVLETHRKLKHTRRRHARRRAARAGRHPCREATAQGLSRTSSPAACASA